MNSFFHLYSGNRKTPPVLYFFKKILTLMNKFNKIFQTIRYLKKPAKEEPSWQTRAVKHKKMGSTDDSISTYFLEKSKFYSC